ARGDRPDRRSAHRRAARVRAEGGRAGAEPGSADLTGRDLPGAGSIPRGLRLVAGGALPRTGFPRRALSGAAPSAQCNTPRGAGNCATSSHAPAPAPTPHGSWRRYLPSAAANSTTTNISTSAQAMIRFLLFGSTPSSLIGRAERPSGDRLISG